MKILVIPTATQEPRVRHRPASSQPFYSPRSDEISYNIFLRGHQHRLRTYGVVLSRDDPPTCSSIVICISIYAKGMGEAFFRACRRYGAKNLGEFSGKGFFTSPVIVEQKKKDNPDVPSLLFLMCG